MWVYNCEDKEVKMNPDDIKRSKEKVVKSTNLTEILNELNQAQSGVKKRQELIRNIQEYLQQKDNKERKLILYISNLGHPNSVMNPGDAVPLNDLLSSIGEVKHLDLMLHSQGGDGNTAEKINSDVSTILR